ncbi:hypothetical protein [Streptomyces viridochromogenes]|uniref:hypothetical protein n=1 Tax=Streptomyces viridochromogenes TaxID=1938 RepID=UPI00131E67FB|nr:hypothetical protein [Streptomyces viridochromogenes]
MDSTAHDLRALIHAPIPDTSGSAEIPIGSPWVIVTTGTTKLGRPMWLVKLAQSAWSKKNPQPQRQ